MAADELVPRPAQGRVFEGQARVRLADVAPDGRLRLDAIARMLQDVSGDDTADAAYASDAAWVVRRLVIDIAPDVRPRLYDNLALATWCSGTGARWAERRTDLGFEARSEPRADPIVRAAALWVFVDRASARPIPLSAGFDAVYGAVAAGRRVGQRLQHGPPPAGEPGTPWPVRATDFDVLGHMNNAAYWAPVEELLARVAPRRPVAWAELEFRGGIEPGDEVRVIDGSEGETLRLWLMVGTDVRGSAVVALGPRPDHGNRRRF